RVDIVPEESPQGQPILSFEVVTSGTSRGGLRPTRILRCLHDINVFNDELFPTNPDIPLHLQAKVRIAPVIGEAGCSLTPTDGGQGINQRLALGSKPTPGAYRVVLRSSIDVPSLLHVDLHGLTVRGASLRKHKQNKLIDSISHALVEEKYRDALALAEDQKMLAGTLAERMMLSEALVHHGRLTEVQATWRELLTSETPKPELDAILTAQLRRSPQLYGSLLSAVSPEQQVRRVTAAWRNFATNHRDRDELRPRFWDAMQNIDIDRSASPKDAVDALRWRARLFSDVGDHQAGLRQLSQALRRLDATPPEDPIRNETWVVA
ncbi:MAG: hypothetical protein ACPG4T_24335, partial [Nannocystaceae bacterium]